MDPNFTFYVTHNEASKIIAALRVYGMGHALTESRDLAARLQRSLTHQQEHRAQAQKEAERLAAQRAERAASHVLTPRQAMCLAAVRAGKAPSSCFTLWMGQYRWLRTQSMGGAVWRMVDRLQDEGLLTERNDLTPEGLARLEAWEAKHKAPWKEAA